MTSRHTPRIAEALDQLILKTGDVTLARAWFRSVSPDAVDGTLGRAFVEILEHGGFVHPARWLKEQGQ